MEESGTLLNDETIQKIINAVLDNSPPKTLAGRFIQEAGYSISVTLISVCILIFGLFIIYGQIKDRGIGRYTFQLFGLILLLPIILLLGAYHALDTTVLATLLGSIAGYIFGGGIKDATSHNPKEDKS